MIWLKNFGAGSLPFSKFSSDVANDVYDSFSDELYDDEDED